MTRNRWCTAAMTFLLATAFNLPAADKNIAENPAVATARQDVAAALKAEAAGDNDERARSLARALSTAPLLDEANWHAARVRIDDEWLTLAEAEKEASRDGRLSEYRTLRDEAHGNIKLTRNLARWCTKNGWHDLARLHDAQLLSRHDVDADTRAEAMKRLDLRNVDGKWVTGEEYRQHEQRLRAVEAAIRTWRPRLKRLQETIDSGDFAASERAVNELQAIEDPQVSVVLESFLIDGGDRFSEAAARLLGKFRHVEATEALVRYAVLCPYASAREAAIAALKERPVYDYMPQLLSGLRAPISTQFSVIVGRNGAVQYTQAIGAEGPGARLISVHSQASLPALYSPMSGAIRPGGRNRGLALNEVARGAFRAQLVQSEAELTNARIAEANLRTFQALEQLADVQLPRDANQYWNWWQDYNQYYWPKPTYYAYQQQQPAYYIAGIGGSCFLAGTLVRTQMGLAAVESIQAGDRVLSQDQNTGELGYQVVLRTTLRPPTKMVRIGAGEDEIITTLGHPFWVNGHGWKMAKELVAGDLLHSLGGAVQIEKVEPAGEQKAFNLVVDDFNTYFVGQAGLLVHDNEFRKPTRAIVPGLVEVAETVAKK
jgi:hypothetical protein